MEFNKTSDRGDVEYKGVRVYKKVCINSVLVYIFYIRILIDGERAFSDKNMDSLNVDDFKVVRIWPSSGRKAYKAERAIRTVIST